MTGFALFPWEKGGSAAVRGQAAVEGPLLACSAALIQANEAIWQEPVRAPLSRGLILVLTTMIGMTAVMTAASIAAPTLKMEG